MLRIDVLEIVDVSRPCHQDFIDCLLRAVRKCGHCVEIDILLPVKRSQSVIDPGDELYGDKVTVTECLRCGGDKMKDSVVIVAAASCNLDHLRVRDQEAVTVVLRLEAIVRQTGSDSREELDIV